MRFLDEIRVGECTLIGSHTFTAAAIKGFAARFDPQPFHLDEAAAARSPFGALCASGWHTASVWMRLIVDHRRAESEARRARGEPVARTGASPGFRDLKWPKPVYAGDTITYATEVIATRALRSRAGWGLMVSRNTGTNAAGELVLSFEGAVFLEMTPA